MLVKSAVLLIFFLLSTMLNNLRAESAISDTLVQPDTIIVTTDTTSGDNSSRGIISEDFGNRLKSQLNLTDEQTEHVRSIIATYIDNYTESGSAASASEQIEQLLDGAQKGSWQSVKDGFWSDLNRRIKDDNE